MHNCLGFYTLWEKLWPVSVQITVRLNFLLHIMRDIGLTLFCEKSMTVRVRNQSYAQENWQNVSVTSDLSVCTLLF